MMIHRTVLCKGIQHSRRQAFAHEVSTVLQLDASLLLMPVLGFLPIDDPRIVRTVAAIERELVSDGLVLRYRTESGADGLPAGEGVFLRVQLLARRRKYQLQGQIAKRTPCLTVCSHCVTISAFSAKNTTPKPGCRLATFLRRSLISRWFATALSLHHDEPLRATSERD